MLSAPILREIMPNNYGENGIKPNFNFDFYLTPSNLNQLKLEVKVIDNDSNTKIDTQINFTGNFTSSDLINNRTPETIPKNKENWHFFMKNNFLPSKKLYKIQIRLLQIKTEEKDGAMIEKILDQSEWSNIVILKSINVPTIEWETLNTINQVNPLFEVSIGDPNELHKCKEYITQYRFYLTDHDLDKKIENSDWLIYNNEEVLSYRFKRPFRNRDNITVSCDIITNNGWHSNLPPLSLAVNIIPGKSLENIFLSVEDSRNDYCNENACMRIFLKSPNPVTGLYYLLRSSEDENYKDWKDISSFFFNEKYTNEETLIYTDYTIESGKRYKYALQEEDPSGLRSDLLLEPAEESRIVYFQHSYLLGEGKQLKLLFNNEISSVKRNLQTNKIETIGKKYPTILKNGNINYLEFPISGLISYQMDMDSTFLNESINSSDRITTDQNGLTQKERYVGSNLTNENILFEKEFRDQVEEFLNNGQNKLFKSATEGNIIVYLMNISLTPEKKLGRMIYNFSATAYQMAETNYENLKLNNIISFKKEEDILKEPISDFDFGQIIIKDKNISINNNNIPLNSSNLSITLDVILNRYYSINQNENIETNLDKILSIYVEPNTASSDIIAPIGYSTGESTETTLPIRMFFNRKYSIYDSMLKELNSNVFNNIVIDPNIDCIINYTAKINKQFKTTDIFKPLTNQSTVALLSEDSTKPTINVNNGNLIDFGQIIFNPANKTQSILTEIRENIYTEIKNAYASSSTAEIDGTNSYQIIDIYKVIISRFTYLEIEGPENTTLDVFGKDSNNSTLIRIGSSNLYVFSNLDKITDIQSDQNGLIINYRYQGLLQQKETNSTKEV